MVVVEDTTAGVVTEVAIAAEVVTEEVIKTGDDHTHSNNSFPIIMALRKDNFKIILIILGMD